MLVVSNDKKRALTFPHILCLPAEQKIINRIYLPPTKVELDITVGTFTVSVKIDLFIGMRATRICSVSNAIPIWLHKFTLG